MASSQLLYSLSQLSFLKKKKREDFYDFILTFMDFLMNSATFMKYKFGPNLNYIC